MRYRVTVYAQRGGQPCYTYTAHARVRPGKVARLVEDTAYDILTHETRGGLTGSVTYHERYAIVRIYGAARFVVAARGL